MIGTNRENAMSCCNKAPKGGASLGMLIKFIAAIFLLLLVLSLFQ
ncbi:putative membrane protein [Photobacterium leiognathi lrivu.4.1]|uniref:Putative membrane protein n=1 Tax=Photobacterium leiognathi lrivu.4.1 TaxID=1248232 RepID=V5F3H3_PHOLE|nr:putative membrane protein [Photobacterium leiognathi lrivu.4.1]